MLELVATPQSLATMSNILMLVALADEWVFVTNSDVMKQKSYYLVVISLTAMPER